MTETIIDDDFVDHSRLNSLQTNSTSRRKMFIETEIRTDVLTKRRFNSNSTIASRSVHDILENTKSPTDGLPPTTYTYAHSVSYMPVMQNATYGVPVMARRDLRSEQQSFSSHNNSAFSSPTKFISSVRTQLVNSYSAIRNRLIHHEQISTPNNLLNSPTRKDSTEIYSNSNSTTTNITNSTGYNLRRRPPVHSTPRDTEFEQNVKLINNEQQDSTVIEPTATVEIQQEATSNVFARFIQFVINIPLELIKYFFKVFFALPWWIIFPLMFFVGFFVIPHLICQRAENNQKSTVFRQCQDFYEYRNNLATKTWRTLRHETFKDFSSIYENAANLTKSSFVGFFSLLSNLTNFQTKTKAEKIQEEKFPIQQVDRNCEKDLKEMQTRIDQLNVDLQTFFSGASNFSVDQEIVVRNLFYRLIEEYAADETGRADYALEANGAKIIDTRCTEYADEPRQNVVKFFGIPIVHMSKQPEIMIRPGRLPGQCFPFKGDQGSVIIKLAVPVKPTEFVLEHLSKNISIVGHISSAPKDFTVYSLLDKTDKEGKVLGRYVYDAENGTSIQRFKPQLVEVPHVEFIEVRVTSNWGNPSYTCLYRFRVHGDLKTVQTSA